MENEKTPKLGSLSVSENAHTFLSNLVTTNASERDSPFTSIVEAFRFAFSLGYSKNIKLSTKGITKTVSPRQFIVNEYTDILENDLTKEYSSLGGLVSAYAEAGTKVMMDWVESGKTIMSLLDEN